MRTLTHSHARPSYSQLKDEDHISLVLIDVVELDYVGMEDLLQNVHLPFNLLSPHPTTARSALALLDEFGSVFHPCALLPTFLHYSKLATAKGKGTVGLTSG